MSYILDALKKSEAERVRKDPAAMLVQEPPRAGQPGWLIPVVVVLVALNLASLGGWLYWQNRAVVPTMVTETPAVADAQPIVRETPAVTDPAVTDEVPVEVSEPAEQVIRPATARAGTASAGTVVQPDASSRTTASTQTSEQPSTESVAAQAVRPASLPAQVQSRLPRLSFSTHIYADDPAFRRVVVNGERAVEGDPLGPDLWLQEITDTGVVIRFEDHLVRLDILQDWRS